MPEPIQIIITLEHTESGYKMNVGCNNQNVFPETIIDACRRAALHYETVLQARTTCQEMFKFQQKLADEQKIRDIIKP